MIVRAERTPNPATMRFLPGAAGLMWTKASFADPASAGRSPLARRLFGIDGVQAVSSGPGFVAVTKAEDADWALLTAPICDAIAGHYESAARMRADDGAEGRAAEIAPELEEIWDYTRGLPRLGDRFEMHRGIQWEAGFSPSPDSRGESEGYTGYLRSAADMQQFALPISMRLDFRRENVRQPVGGIPWERMKILLKGSRTGGNAWRSVAALNTEGLSFSRQFIGLRPRRDIDDLECQGYSAVINGPFANAFLATHNKGPGLRIGDVKSIAVPEGNLSDVGKLVYMYTRSLRRIETPREDEEEMERLLTRIDAATLDMYKLPARLERTLLSLFRGSYRPVAHRWRHWDEVYPGPGQTLAERVSGKFRERGAWILDVFRPLPENEAALFEKYGV